MLSILSFTFLLWWVQTIWGKRICEGIFSFWLTFLHNDRTFSLKFNLWSILTTLINFQIYVPRRSQEPHKHLKWQNLEQQLMTFSSTSGCSVGNCLVTNLFFYWKLFLLLFISKWHLFGFNFILYLFLTIPTVFRLHSLVSSKHLKFLNQYKMEFCCPHSLRQECHRGTKRDYIKIYFKNKGPSRDPFGIP